MTDLAQVVKQIQGMSTALQALEKTLAQSERERWLHDCSPDRIPELVAEGALLAEKYQCPYAVVKNLDGVFALVHAGASNRNEWIRFIGCAEHQEEKSCLKK